MSRLNEAIIKAIGRNPWMSDAEIGRFCGASRSYVARVRAADLGMIARVNKGDEMFTEEEMTRLDKWLVERGLMKPFSP